MEPPDLTLRRTFMEFYLQSIIMYQLNTAPKSTVLRMRHMFVLVVRRCPGNAKRFSEAVKIILQLFMNVNSYVSAHRLDALGLKVIKLCNARLCADCVSG